MRPALPALAVSAVLAMAASANATDIDGHWARGDGKARVDIDPCGSDICATNTWIAPGTPSEKVGDKLVMTIKQTSDGQYAGTAYDPQRHLTYRLNISASAKTMTTKGCVLAGIVCRDVTWTRLD